MSNIKELVFEELLTKYVTEEIMTKSEFAAVQKEISAKYDERFRWLIATILGSCLTIGFGLAGLMIALLHH